VADVGGPSDWLAVNLGRWAWAALVDQNNDLRGEVRGQTTVRARATDQAGNTQPEQPEWNRLGYGGNAIQAISIVVK
jgi:hypothetical protein